MVDVYDEMKKNVLCFLHEPPGFSARSGMRPVAEYTGSSIVRYRETWRRYMKYSWRFGHILQRWGRHYYQSDWNALVPWMDELKFLRIIKNYDNPLLHFLWGEFASPAWSAVFRKKSRGILGTFHCSERRLPRVITGSRPVHSYDVITLMSETQRAYFNGLGVPDDRIRVYLHGVDTEYFKPLENRPAGHDRKLNCFLLGETERDHEFMYKVLKKLPPNSIRLYVKTFKHWVPGYRQYSQVEILPFMSDEELLKLYQVSDLLLMPMLDCTANNVFLESMACGTPVMTNRVGGVSEYIADDCNIIMEDKSVDEWVDRLMDLSENRQQLTALRPAVRVWAETFEWKKRVEPFKTLYSEFK